jgi:aerobic carbon-monoxide dehydrogenase medium subunit
MYSFEYQRPATIPEVVGAATDDARYLAGGQTLVQAMRLRLSNSTRLVDLGSVPALRGIAITEQCAVIGAMTRHAEVAHSAQVRRLIPGLSELAEGIGDQMVRNMGTLGGSLANADPAACYPAAVLALNATIKTDRRTIAADDFFLGIYQTALEPGELIVSVAFPKVEHSAYIKFKQPASRFAVVGVFVAKSAAGVRVAVTGAQSSVFRARELEAAYSRNFHPEAAVGIELGVKDMASDMHNAPEYRAALASVLASRAVAKALARADQNTEY